MLKGTVRWFDVDKGYGFIRPDGEATDVFVHVKELKKTGLQQLMQDQKVIFSTAPGREGTGPKAVDVRVEG